MNEKTIKFTKHAIERAKQRKLWPFVDKKKVFYDSQLLGTDKYILEDVIYVMKYVRKYNKVITMYRQ